MGKGAAAGRTGKRGLTWDALRAFAHALPGVEDGRCFGTPALYVRKKLMARLKEDGATVAVRCDCADREVLLAAHPRAFFLTDHYRAYPMVLLRLPAAPVALARDVIEAAWRWCAPKTLLARPAAAPKAPATRARRAKRA